MGGNFINIVQHLSVAALAGGLIGFERSYHGRPAGFRTHILVCMASSILMLVTIYQEQWFTGVDLQTISIDPTRMAQGVMTGIGFLGAGVIMREGLSVRGLTTAASIWITAAIGILVGVGFYGAVVVATLFALVVVVVFRWVEEIIPTLSYARLILRFRRDTIMPEAELTELITKQGFSLANVSYSLEQEGAFFQYSMTIRTPHKDNMRRLSNILSNHESIIEFQILQVGD